MIQAIKHITNESQLSDACTFLCNEKATTTADKDFVCTLATILLQHTHKITDKEPFPFLQSHKSYNFIATGFLLLLRRYLQLQKVNLNNWNLTTLSRHSFTCQVLACCLESVSQQAWCGKTQATRVCEGKACQVISFF